jgi:AP-2 complex subunit alpha
LSQANGTLATVDPQSPSADLLGDLLGPLAIEGPPGAAVQFEPNAVSGLEGVPIPADDAAAIVPVGKETNSVQVCSLLLCYCLFSLGNLDVKT